MFTINKRIAVPVDPLHNSVYEKILVATEKYIRTTMGFPIELASVDYSPCSPPSVGARPLHKYYMVRTAKGLKDK